MKYITKTIESLEESGILIKGVSEVIENKTKEQTGAFLIMLLGTLGGSSLEIYYQLNMLFALENAFDSSSSLN